MSDKAIRGLDPAIVWQRFYEISQIPRPSKKEEKILQYLRNIAKELSLNIKEDNVGNMVMSVKATPGYENAKIVVLQSHVDMVCEKNKGTDHDFNNDPITLVRDDDWIRAEGTTLGSDNGIGIAASIAVASDRDVIHGPLELLFTVDEETGLTGANNLRPGFITGKTLLNLDSEEGGSFYVGCSGGQDTVGIFEIEEMNASKGLAAYDLLVGGLKGGHSGLDIHVGRANAIKLLGRFLKKLEGINHQVAEITGGSKRNAIPREAEATVLLNPSDEEIVKKTVNTFFEEAMMEYQKNDGGLKIELIKKEKSYEKVFTKGFLAKIVNVILALPHGVIAMSPDIPDLVETSTNLATVVRERGKIKIETSQRSSIKGAKAYIASSVKSLFKLADAEIFSGSGYPGWKPNLNSEILRIAKEVYEKLFEKEPRIKAIHAGLECAIFSERYPGLDMVSFGPTIRGAHSPEERVNINEVERFYDLLKGILLELAMQRS